MKKHVTVLFILTTFLTGFAQVFETPEEVKPLLVGEAIPDLSLTSLANSKEKIRSVISKRPSILLFYRGGWCPYCNKHLSAVGEVKEEINAMGYQIIGISPDSPAKLNETIEKGKLGYALYSDSDTKLIRSMGIAYRAPDRYATTLASFSNNLNDHIIPVPSLYVVDQDGKIMYQYSDSNYKERISSKKLLKELKRLNKE